MSSLPGSTHEYNFDFVVTCSITTIKGHALAVHSNLADDTFVRSSQVAPRPEDPELLDLVYEA